MKNSTFPLGPGWPESQTPSTAAPRSVEPVRDTDEHLQMDARVAHHTALSDLLATGFELGLDEHQAPIVDAGAF